MQSVRTKVFEAEGNNLCEGPKLRGLFFQTTEFSGAWSQISTGDRDVTEGAIEEVKQRSGKGLVSHGQKI